MTTVVIIQARVGSTRLPEKVLADIAGEPMLAHVVTRAERIAGVNSVVVATTTESADDRIATLCRRRGWRCFRGSELDVLARYFDAAREYGADLVVRVTSDCPLLDPGVGSRVVQVLLRQGGTIDYVSNTLQRTFPRGLDIEAFTYGALERAFHGAADLSQREHVTPYIWQHPETFNLAQVIDDADHSDLRWTVDTAEDLRLIRTVFEAFGGESFGYREVLSLFDSRPELAKINAHIQQKPV